MKKQLLTIVTLAVVLGTANAQQAVTRVYTEKTHVSPKTGIAIGYESKYGIELGAFFQESHLLEKALNQYDESVEQHFPKQYEKQFYGAYFGGRFYSTPWYNVKFNVRVGVTNQINFAITPSTLVDLKPTKNVNLTLGVGMRSFKPTLQYGLTVKI